MQLGMFHITMNLGELSELILIHFCPYTRFYAKHLSFVFFSSEERHWSRWTRHVGDL